MTEAVLESQVFMDKLRVDTICKNCRIHTIQRNTRYGWVCGECGVLQDKKEGRDDKRNTK